DARTFPFTLRTHGLRGGEIVVDASASSQILSALLLVAPLATAPMTIKLTGKTVSEPFVEMTLRKISQFGQDAKAPTDGVFHFAGRDAYHPPIGAVYTIEPDATAASYFLALPLVAPIGVRVNGLPEDSLQGDIAFADVLQKIGGDLDFNAISDTFLTLAALAPLLTTPLTIRGVAHARKQETDRLLAVAVELEKLGQRVSPTSAELRADTTLGSITIYPDRAAMRRLTATAPIHIHTYDDHRMAMSFAILGCHDLHGDGRPWLAIEDPACCAKTFPDFFDVLAQVRNGTDYA
ncbi:MAG: hypothetical protein LBV28_02985, partial [Puniceicoccales bacterium]|nr:hypothetical protein [Puniceicoccales bacterium]